MSALRAPPVCKKPLSCSHCSNAAWRLPVSSDLEKTATTAGRRARPATRFANSSASSRAMSPCIRWARETSASTA